MAVRAEALANSIVRLQRISILAEARLSMSRLERHLCHLLGRHNFRRHAAVGRVNDLIRRAPWTACDRGYRNARGH